jgi:hypothetical protein
LDADPGDPNHADADVDLQHWKKNIFQDFLMDLGCFFINLCSSLSRVKAIVFRTSN